MIVIGLNLMEIANFHGVATKSDITFLTQHNYHLVMDAGSENYFLVTAPLRQPCLVWWYSYCVHVKIGKGYPPNMHAQAFFPNACHYES